MKNDKEAKDPAWQGDAGWGVAKKDNKFVMIEDPPGSQHWIRALRSCTTTRLTRKNKLTST